LGLNHGQILQGANGLQAEEFQAGNEDVAWEAVQNQIQNEDIQAEVQQPPQHPEFPQHIMDLDLSGSSMSFLRANGPDISLDDVFGDSSSSSSSDATSIPLENEENLLRFLAAQSHCASITIFHRRGIPFSDEATSANSFPSSFAIKHTLIEKPVSIHTSDTQEAFTGQEIVPWQPCIPALLLQLWPNVLQAWRQKRSAEGLTPISTVGPPIHDTEMTSPDTVEFQPSFTPSTDENQPSTVLVRVQLQPSPATRGRKKKTARSGNVSLPTTISNLTSPLVDGNVRRSSRLNKNDGFCAVRLER